MGRYLGADDKQYQNFQNYFQENYKINLDSNFVCFNYSMTLIKKERNKYF